MNRASSNSGNSALDNSALDHPGSQIQERLGATVADRRFLRAVFIDLTGRTPLPDDLAAAEGLARGEVVRRVAHSLPFFYGMYEEELFYFLLLDNFRPSTDQFAEFPELLHERRATLFDFLRVLVSSQFFNARNPGNDTFVTVVLEQLLGITVQKDKRTLEAGKKMYDGKSVRFLGERGSSQADLVRIAVDHPDCPRFWLNRQYHNIFGGDMPDDRLERDTERLLQDPHCFPGLIADWLSSQAYEDRLQELRPKSDRIFLRSLFVDLLGREAEYQEFRRSRNALLALSDSGPLRSVVIKLILDSELVDAKDFAAGSPAETVDGLFRRFLCRAPTAEEREAFTAEFGKPGVSIGTLVRALLTHWEYQHY